MRIAIILLLLNSIIMIYASAQKKFDLAMKYWGNGEVHKAHETAESALRESPVNNRISDLLMKSFFVQGKYKEALQTFMTIDTSYRNYKESVELAIEANLHLQYYDEAAALAREKRSKLSPYLEEFISRRFKAIADQTYMVPFSGDDKISANYWPGIKGIINGVLCLIRFDTGGTYIVAGVEAAKKLSIPLKNKHTTTHAATIVKGWHSIIDSMRFDAGPAFRNIPVTIMESIGGYVIFGTNLIEQFLTTVDYPNNRFIFSPRGQSAEEHYKLLPAKQMKLPFYLWSDHFMMAKGKLGDHDNLMLFFDSGLITMTDVDGKLKQASFMASKEALMKWGFRKRQLSKSTFFPTNYSFEAAGLSQSNTLIWYDHNLKKDWSFGGIRINGLISHAWLRNYGWTIDFDKMEYTFGIRD